MIQIRKSNFETNSSSTHSICITKSNDYTLPEKLEFRLQEFGWEFRSYYDTQSKANYLLTGLNGFFYAEEEKIREYKEWIFKVLGKYGVECEFYDEEYDGWSPAIDHDMELEDFLRNVLHSEKTLIRYLFSAESFILTGNDNSYGSVEINVTYPHNEYYKDN